MSDRQPGQSPDAVQQHGERAVRDALHHEKLAAAIVHHIYSLRPGSVIAVQGTWGRGKTDVVDRVYRRFEAADGPEPIWINPWEYGRPDLIQPVVVELLRRSKDEEQVRRDRIRKIAKALLHASNAMAFKAVSAYVPFGAILDPAQQPVDALINRAFGDGAQPEADADPVRGMARQFRALVEATVSANPAKRLLICVDDLDRCLPDNQIALLEAIHFLTSAQANCTFLIAIDPFLVQQAALAHYRTDNIDINQYLDKLFHLRINLTSLLDEQIGDLVGAELDDEVASKELSDGLDVHPAAVRHAFSAVFRLPELTNPRLVHRVFERLRLAAAVNAEVKDPVLRGEASLEPLVAWCAIAERWPQLRQLLQATHGGTDAWLANINVICGSYDCWLAEPPEGAESALKAAASIIGRLPGPKQQPDLGTFLNREFTKNPTRAALVFQQIDRALVPLGL